MKKTTWDGSNDWVNKLTEMQLGSEMTEVPSDYFQSLSTTRQRLKMKAEYSGWHWSFKSGKGLITIKRTK